MVVGGSGGNGYYNGQRNFVGYGPTALIGQNNLYLSYYVESGSFAAYYHYNGNDYKGRGGGSGALLVQNISSNRTAGPALFQNATSPSNYGGGGGGGCQSSYNFDLPIYTCSPTNGKNGILIITYLK